MYAWNTAAGRGVISVCFTRNCAVACGFFACEFARRDRCFKRMLFNSYPFLFGFLPVVLFGYFFLARKRRTRAASVFLVLASLVFYAWWDARYLPLLLGSIAFNYAMGRRIEQTRSKRWLALGVGVNFLLLGYFKYAGFFVATGNALFGVARPVPEIVLPLGISFFTFTQTAYLVDAYRGETQRYAPLTYALFVTVFPHLIAGPILYHKDMIPQFSRLRNFVFSYKNLAIGLTVLSIGLFKKVVIADTLAPWANLAFANAWQLTFLEAWAGALAYTLQLYFDFSGYSEMALGLGYMFNLRLPVNFNAPYKARSIIDFWRRWHMTLSAFLKSYLYIPLGGGRGGEWKRMRNLLLTMLLGGLWHGAGWTFVVWGALHGFYLVVNHQWRRLGCALPAFASWLLTFLCVTVAWVFFRADNLSDALHFVAALGDVRNIVLPEKYAAKLGALAACGVDFGQLFAWKGAQELRGLAVCLVLATCFKTTQEYMTRFEANWKTALGTAMLLAAALFYMRVVQSEFLYFQF